MIDDVISQASQHCEIRAGYRLVDVKKPVDRHDGLYVGGTFFTMQKIVTGQLKKAERVAVFVCTIGPGMEAWARQVLREGDAALSYVVDTIASVTVETATDRLHDHIGRHMLARGMRITNRYSPGYCDWSVSEQSLLFSLLPENFCGVTLTELAFMVPMKSPTGQPVGQESSGLLRRGKPRHEEIRHDRLQFSHCTQDPPYAPPISLPALLPEFIEIRIDYEAR
jgi:hypothetical protein